MNVEIGAEAALFPEKEYINGIADAVRCQNLKWTGPPRTRRTALHILYERKGRLGQTPKLWALVCTGSSQDAHGKISESKEKHGVRDPRPELTLTSPCGPLQSQLQHIYHGKSYARVNPVKESTLSPSQGLWIWPLTVSTTRLEVAGY